MTDDHQQPAVNQAQVAGGPRVGKGIVAGLIGIGVCVVCLIPPLIHFVTGPLGPLIGGFAAGARIGAKGQEPGIIAVTMGLGIGLIVGTIVLAGALTAGGRFPPAVALAAGGGALVYAGGMSWLGAWFGGQRDERPGRGSGGSAGALADD